MAKEWILNSATNRFQLNFSRNVGKVADRDKEMRPKNFIGVGRVLLQKRSLEGAFDRFGK